MSEGTTSCKRALSDDPGILHHSLDLLVQLVAVGDNKDAGLGIVFHQPFGEEHHKDALAAALGVPDNAALALTDTLLRRLHARELMWPGHFFDSIVEDDEVTNQVEQA